MLCSLFSFLDFSLILKESVKPKMIALKVDGGGTIAVRLAAAAKQVHFTLFFFLKE